MEDDLILSSAGDKVQELAGGSVDKDPAQDRQVLNMNADTNTTTTIGYTNADHPSDEGMLHKAGAKVQEMASAAKEKMANAADSVMGTAHNAKEKVKDMASDTKDTTKAYMDTTQQKCNQCADDANHKLQHAENYAGEQLHRAGDHIQAH